jgi:hypothetical protein
MNAKFVILTIGLIALSFNTQAKSLIEKILDKATANINKSAKIEGPVYRHSLRNNDNYGDQVAKIIIEEAHKLAVRFKNEGNSEAYYAFMTLALTVPNHEGLFVHFREVKGETRNCTDSRSKGEGIISRKAKLHFKKAFNENDKGAYLVECDELEGEKTFNQLIVGGADGSDVGMLQLSSLWHYDQFLDKGKYASVRETVQYGLVYLMKGYKKAVRKYAGYKCFSKSDGTPDYTNLIRGAWSAYNGGPSKLCRFSNPDDPHASKDKGFKGNLKKTLDLNNDGPFGFNQEAELELTPNVRKAIEQIINNMENKTDSFESIDALLVK